ncbi:TIGR02757 family protein [Olivibacter sp. SDN3]|uniref:TIGR02757 family protein n=1 Tax=Olivibacter sp. SDN3 TaxID=2764720 RepID=UPI001650DA24|nr:TIGR02757 family protein [Olivibacter sp. SDN3]QNL49864.1 TIGR02757 family protein [Olivibacter sp. SDN3]
MDLKGFLDRKVTLYNQPEFIANDPIGIPHLFTSKQDIEIMGFFAAILAWGQRKTIINKCRELIGRMDGSPYDFICNHRDQDLKHLLGFKHRTFNDTDLLYFVSFFRNHYQKFESLEQAFVPDERNVEFRSDYFITAFTPNEGMDLSSEVCYQHKLAYKPVPIEAALNYFRAYFFGLPDYPQRTRKHISSPAQKSTCKRLNMFLRWMVRKDRQGVDFGIWKNIAMADLICPCDVHVDRVARQLGLITRKQTDWQTAVELTENLRQLDPHDPVKYDFALFGLGVEGEL